MKVPSPLGPSVMRTGRCEIRRLVACPGGVLACAALATGALGTGEAIRRHGQGRRRGADEGGRARKRLYKRTGVDLMCGAAAEVADMLMSYPFDTIKGLKYYSQFGLSGRLLGKLYAGAGAATLMSLLVGPVYYASYSAAKRAGAHWLAQPQDCTSTSHNAGVVGGKDERYGAGNGRLTMQNWIFVNLFASFVAGVAVSIVESPAELFRHQVQAGVVQHGVFPAMAAGLRRGGLASLYFCYLPFLVKSLPFDVAELMTYGLLTDARNAQTAHPASHATVLSKIPGHVGDLFVGAAAGFMAVMVSMPADTITTRMQTVDRAGVAGRGLAGIVVSFFATGRRLVASGGVGSLFVGCAPRLLRHVPSSMVFWPVLMACQRALGQGAESEAGWEV